MALAFTLVDTWDDGQRIQSLAPLPRPGIIRPAATHSILHNSSLVRLGPRLRGRHRELDRALA